ncbi:MAG: type II secretion system F family protein [Granulosicoccus sp.]
MAFFQLSRMLSAGVSLSDALDDLASLDKQGRRHLSWGSVADLVSSGQSLSQALVAKPGSKDQTIIALLKAGEAGGQLDSACEAIYEYLKWHHDLRQRLFTLLIYPLFSLCVLLAVTGFLFVSVVPSIKGFLMASGDALEWHTRALIGFSDWMNRYYVTALLVGIAVTLLLFVLQVCSRRVRTFFDRCVIKLPVTGKLVVDLTLSRYALCCAQLYANGVALETSMALAEGTIRNRTIRSDLQTARIMLVSGSTLADSFKTVSMLPPLFTRLVYVGETAGQLAEVLTQIGGHQSSTAEASIKRTEQLLGPMLLMIVGSMLLWIVISMLAPVYTMAIATVVGAS